LCVLAYGWDLANSKLGTSDPAEVFCREMGYVVEGDYCVFPDGQLCGAEAFLNGECGQAYVHPVACAGAGQRRGVAVECCGGLVEISNSFPIEHACVHLFGFSLCAACGDGECDTWENPCNCPEDCKTCVGEGETVPVIVDPLSCCRGLTLIQPKSPGLHGIHGYCTERCGDGICDPRIESAFNCPGDCRSVKRFTPRRARWPGRTRLGIASRPDAPHESRSVRRTGQPGRRPASPWRELITCQARHATGEPDFEEF
jgi:hypothetical protein